MNDDLIFWILAGTVIIGGILYNGIFGRAAKVKRKLKNGIPRSISSVKEGEYVKIIGEVKSLGKTLRAPISGYECLHFHVVVEEYERLQANRNKVVVIDKEFTIKFLLKNGGNYALIDTGSNITKSALEKRFYQKPNLSNGGAAYFEKFLKECGYSSIKSFESFGTKSYEEGIIEVDEKIAVLGKGSWRPAKEVGIPEKYAQNGKILVMQSSKGKPIYLSDYDDVVTQE